ncbi:MAG: ABC transporter permease [Treponema sp.]|nr:ABC transporter permease [Treponema sp.]
MKWIKPVLISLISLLVSLVVGGIIIGLAGYPVGTAYGSMIQGAFGDMDKFADTLGTATPLLFTGLAVAFAMKGGLINIGGEGQLLAGAMAAALVGVNLKLPPFFHIPLCFLAAAAAGGFWAGLTGWLKVKLRINEIVLAIMLNYIVIYLTNFIVTYLFKAESWVVKSPDVQPSAMLPKLYPHTRFTLAFPIAMVLVLVVFWFFRRTSKGFEIRALGGNFFAAEAGGVVPGRDIVITMLISGAIAGLAGASEVLGVYRYFISGFSPGYGYDGLAVAMLGQYNPLGVALAAIFMGTLRNGAAMLDRTTSIPADFVVIIQAVIILVVATPRLIRGFESRLGAKR